MNHPQPSEEDASPASQEEMFSALFANLIVQQANLALMFLGKAAHPETGEVMVDLESARLMIGQLEMLEFKTRGNLDKREAGLLQQSLTTLRMAFVEAVDRPGAAGPSAPTAPPPVPTPGAQTVPPAEAAPEPSAPGAPASAPKEAEHRTRFSKKY